MDHVLAFEITGCVNGVPVALVGHGLLREGRVELDLAEGPGSLRWERALGLLAVLDPLVLAISVAPPSPDGAPSSFDADMVLADEAAREVGRARLTGLVQLDDGLVRLHAQHLDARYQLEVGERVTRVLAPYPVSVLPGAAGRVVATSAWSFETTRGAVLSGAVLTRCEVAGDVGAQLLQVDSVTVVRGRNQSEVRVAVVHR